MPKKQPKDKKDIPPTVVLKKIVKVTNNKDIAILDTYMDVLRLPKTLLDQYKQLSDTFKELLSIKPRERGEVMMFGKAITVPRTQKSYLRDYAFTGMNHKAEKTVPACVVPIFKWANETDYSKPKEFNQLLINWYENGNEYIGAHSDDESQLEPDGEIMSISLGQTRTFRIRDKSTKAKVKDLELRHGDVVVMKKGMQKRYTHEIVKVGGKKGSGMACRVNITLRKFL